MAGILANSASATMLAGDTSADNARAGYVTNERILLTTNPSGTDYVWSLSWPSTSNRARSALDATTGASVSFTPDVGGLWTIQCIVDSATAYVLRLSVTSVGISQLVEVIRLSPISDASVPAPAVGLSMYLSIEQAGIVAKDPAGDIFPVELGAAV
jgi:hypothetical protein